MQSPDWQQCKCGASWLGHYWERCDWCWNRGKLLDEQLRQNLLQPDWLQVQGPKYWEMDPASKAVWNATRGIDQGEDVVRKWERDLVQATKDGLISEGEAVGALGRWKKLALTQLSSSTMTGKPTRNHFS